jgi:hypothetical protein
MKAILFFLSLFPALLAAGEESRFEYRLLATTKTSTMERELNEAAQAGFVFSGVMGGESAFGGKEVVVIMARARGGDAPRAPRSYRLLATNRTRTLEKEMQASGAEGFDYKGQTIFESAFGGREVAVILERDSSTQDLRFDYRLLATSKTSTMEKELSQAGQEGFVFQGVVVGQTAFGGNEVVSILKKTR